ncbi:MAG: NAD(P)-dependent oxidoreductase [Pseudomonadota bacterium]
MRILLTGGRGSVGQGLVPALLQGGHQVLILDQEPGALSPPVHPHLDAVTGCVEDGAGVAQACGGIEAIIHLAWSFSDDPVHLLEHDLRGHLHLLSAAREHGIKHFLYASTAVVYGKPLRAAIREDDTLQVLAARKPAYGIAKDFAEKLTLLAARETDLSATVLRFWWSFGDEIAGRHLRDMLRTAAAGKPLQVPADCGGSFLSQLDFNRAVALVLSRPTAGGRVFNLASAYVTWEEVARMVVRVTGSSSVVEVVPKAAWEGAAFLADRWELDDHRIREALGFAPAQDPADLRAALQRAIARTWERIQSSPA